MSERLLKSSISERTASFEDLVNEQIPESPESLLSRAFAPLFSAEKWKLWYYYLMKWINRLYILFVGIILTTTTGFGIAAFYPEPVRPTYPLDYNRVTVPTLCYETPQAQQSAECQKIIQQQQQEQQKNITQQQAYEEELREFNNINAGYTRTAIFLGISIGALFAIIGIGLIKFSPLIANGVILAGVLTAILTRFLIMLASLGARTTGTTGADIIGYVQFGILTLLSIAVLFVGFTTLKKAEEKN